MATTEVEIYNLALNAIGARNNVVAPDERSREAEVCRLWYKQVRDQVLAAAPWPAAMTFVRLALLSETDEEVPWASGAPQPGFQYAYSSPTDMLRPRYLTSFARFTMTSYPSGINAIMTGQVDAILAYTSKAIAIGNWDSQLQMSIIYGLAAHICMPLSGKTQRSRAMLEQANLLIETAREGAANVNDEMFEAIPDWISARGYSGGYTQTRYLYPNGNLLTGSI